MESVKPFALPEMMQRILQHPTATFSSMQEGIEKNHVQMPVASVERLTFVKSRLSGGFELQVRLTEPQS